MRFLQTFYFYTIQSGILDILHMNTHLLSEVLSHFMASMETQTTISFIQEMEHT